MHKEYDLKLSFAVEAKLAKTNSKKTGDYWGPFDCPLCGKKNKGYTFSASPHRFMCNSAGCEAYKDNGGVSMAELVGFTFDVEKEYKKNPEQIWRAYLQSRGLFKVIKGLPAQHWSNIRKTGRGGVMIKVGKNVDKESVQTGRIYRPIDKNRSHTTKKITGCIFQHPAIKHDYDKPVFIVEGWLNSLSFEEINQQSVAIISTNQKPSAIAHHLERYKHIVFCFDWDKAGVSCCRKYLKQHSNAEVIFFDQGMDSNDLLCRAGSAEKAIATFKANYERYVSNGKLALASSAFVHGKLNYELFGRTGLFDFGGSTWFSEVKSSRKDGELRAKTERCGLFKVSSVYSVVSDGMTDNLEFQYRLQIDPIGSKPIQATATDKDLRTARDFNSFLMRTCHCVWEGNVPATTALQVKIVTSKPPLARKIGHYGFDRTSHWWISYKWAVSQDGKLLNLNEQGLFEMDKQQLILPISREQPPVIITPSFKPKHNVKDIYKLLDQAYPGFGAIAFSWYVGSLFLDELKFNQLGFYPFLSISGPSGCGKSCLTEELQLFQGWDSEGRDLSNSSTHKGLSRELYKASNMFRAILEVTDETEKVLSKFINILGAYNRGGGSIKANFTNDNSVNTNELYCSLLFCQNVEIWRNKQQKTRSVSLNISEDYMSDKTMQAYKQLQLIPKADKAAVMIAILKKRKAFTSNFADEYTIAMGDLELCPPGRVKNNHAVLLAIHTIFCKLFKVASVSNVFAEIESTAISKHESANQLDVNPASSFFENVIAHNTAEIKKYWTEITDLDARNYGVIYIAVNIILRELRSNGFLKPEQSEIETALKSHPAYLSHGQNYNFKLGDKNGKTIVHRRKAWKLDAKKFRETEDIDPNLTYTT